LPWRARQIALRARKDERQGIRYHLRQMYIPRLHEKVFIAGGQGVFLVVWVDRQREMADLIPLRDAAGAKVSVPFAQLEPYRDKMPPSGK
jgi:hypothetical protein